MTTVAYRDGVLAADSLCTNDGVCVGSAEKAASFGPLLVGCAGSIGLVNRFLDWMRQGADGEPPLMAGDADTDATAIVVMPDGLIVTFDKYGRDRIRAPFYAIGSGWRIAMGAMAAGAGPEEAVKAAAALDVYTGGAIRVFRRQPAQG